MAWVEIQHNGSYDMRALQLPSGCLIETYTERRDGNEYDGVTAMTSATGLVFIPQLRVSELLDAVAEPIEPPEIIKPDAFRRAAQEGGAE